MKRIYTLLFCAFTLTSLAQENLWTKTISKKTFLKQLDNGNILIKNENEIQLVDNLTGDELWTSQVTTGDDPKFLNDLPFMYFSGKDYAFIDASTGVIIDKSPEKTLILNTHYFWDQSRVIVEEQRGDNLHILNIDLNDVSKSWNVNAGEVQKQLFGLAARGTKNKPSLTKNGNLLLVDKKFINILDNSGKAINRIDFDKKLKKLDFNAEADILYVVEDKKKVHFVNVNSGVTVATIELEEKNPNLNILEDGKYISIIQKKKCTIYNAMDGTEIASHECNDKISDSYISNNGDFLILSKKTIKRLNPANAEVLAEKTYDTDFKTFFPVEDVLFVKGSKINEISPLDLSPKYAKSINFGLMNYYYDTPNGRIYTSLTGEKLSMLAVDHSGKKLWNKDTESPVVYEFQVQDNGLLLIDGKEAVFLDYEKGKNIWDKSIKTGGSYAAVTNASNTNMVIHADKRLHFFDKQSSVLTSSSEKVKFKDFDYETQSPQMLLFDEHLFLKGSNSIYITDLGGNILHTKNYNKSDNTSGLLKLANVAVQVAAIGSGNADEVVTVTSNGQESRGSMVNGLNDNWEYAEQKAAERKAKQNRSSNEFPYVFTKSESGERCLIFINPRTGEENYSIPMKEKTPTYVIDEIDGVVYYINKTELKAIKL